MRPLVNKTPIGMNEEFENAIKPYMHDLRRYCLSLAKTMWDGEDLMQETLLKAYKSWLQTPKQIAKAYLFRIASNTWIDKYRKRKLDEDMNQDITELKREDNPVNDGVFQAIGVLVNKLSSKQRIVILLVEGFGYTVKEIADELSMSEGSVKALLHRARNKIKQLNFYNENPDLEEDESFTYVTVLRNGNADAVIRLYQEEIKEPVMSSNGQHNLHPSSIFQSFGTGGTFYVLVSIQKRNGETLFVPFYQSELSTLLSQLAMIREQTFSTVA